MEEKSWSSYQRIRIKLVTQWIDDHILVPQVKSLSSLSYQIFSFLFAFSLFLPRDLLFISFQHLVLLSCHFHFVLSLGAVIAIFSGIIFNGEKIVGSKNLLPSLSSTLSLYHLVSTFIGILLTFSPMHFLGFNVMPRRIPDFPDSFHSWNFLSSIGSGITFLSFAIFFLQCFYDSKCNSLSCKCFSISSFAWKEWFIIGGVLV